LVNGGRNEEQAAGAKLRESPDYGTTKPGQGAKKLRAQSEAFGAKSLSIQCSTLEKSSIKDQENA
jgi:hypothetical protein